MSDRWAQRAPWTGIAAVVFFIAAFIIGGETPDFDASTREIVNYYNDQTAQVVTSILLLYGSILLVFFAASLRSALRDADALSGLVFIGGTLMAVGAAIFAGLNFTLTDLANSDHLDRVDLSCLERGDCGLSQFSAGWAAHTLAHEAFHLRGFQDEGITECYALQNTAYVAERLGVPTRQAEVIQDPLQFCHADHGAVSAPGQESRKVTFIDTAGACKFGL